MYCVSVCKCIHLIFHNAYAVGAIKFTQTSAAARSIANEAIKCSSTTIRLIFAVASSKSRDMVKNPL